MTAFTARQFDRDNTLMYWRALARSWCQADESQLIGTPKKIPSREGWRPKAAGVGPFSTPQPTPGPDGPLPSQEGIPLRFPDLHHAAPTGVGSPMDKGYPCDSHELQWLNFELRLRSFFTGLAAVVGCTGSARRECAMNFPGCLDEIDLDCVTLKMRTNCGGLLV